MTTDLSLGFEFDKRQIFCELNPSYFYHSKISLLIRPLTALWVQRNIIVALSLLDPISKKAYGYFGIIYKLI